MFTFRQFVVHDDRCAMKVGTDGVLLGAWAQLCAVSPIDSPHPDNSSCPSAQLSPRQSRVLDVGCGCGLIALMLAQRFPNTHFVALEIDREAAGQAAENVNRSPFSAQIEVRCGDFLNDKDEEALRKGELFDAVVSNPPFFEETLLSPVAHRAQARHTATGLTFERLTARASSLLRPGGTLEVIIPKTAQDRFHAAAADVGFSLFHTTDVQTVARKVPKRVLLRFAKSESPHKVKRDTLVLMSEGERSEQYARLCQDFYL